VHEEKINPGTYLAPGEHTGGFGRVFIIVCKAAASGRDLDSMCKSPLIGRDFIKPGEPEGTKALPAWVSVDILRCKQDAEIPGRFRPMDMHSGNDI
jgi:hypothetical protein